MNVQMLPTSSLKPYERNARVIPSEAVRKVAKSLTEFGWRQPIVVDAQRIVICGHTRLLAAQQMGFDRVPVHIAENLTAEQVKAYRLMDNRSHEEASWDDNILKSELVDLSGFEIDLELTGFGLDEISSILDATEPTDGLVDEDDVPRLPVDPVSKPGDLWILGPHRLLCGDATDHAHIERLMDGEVADMVFTDPPYNVDYKQKRKGDKTGGRGIKNDALGLQFEDFLRDACTNILNSCRGAVYIAMSSSELHTLKRAFTDAGGHWSTFVIWAKQTFTLGRSDYQRQYEPILYGWREGGTHHWCGTRNEGDVWFINKPFRNELHPTQKPVEVVQRAIRNSSQRGNLILDPFAGSGTTMLACERTGRHARLLELDPAYADVIVNRYEQFTGMSANVVRESEWKA
jgi:DNA modification methylase